MYEVTNGILHNNGRPELAIGVSYYASYHNLKVPVPENGDRVGEMKKDLQKLIMDQLFCTSISMKHTFNSPVSDRIILFGSYRVHAEKRNFG